MHRERIMELIGAHVEAENRHDMEATLRTLHPACEFVDHAMQRTFSGHAGAREHYEMWWRGFDLQVGGGRHYVDGGVFVAETRFRGRHRGEFMGVPAGGRLIDLGVAVVVEVKEGLMAAERFYYDMRELMAQIRGEAR